MIRLLSIFCFLLVFLVGIQAPQHLLDGDSEKRHEATNLLSKRVSVGLDGRFSDAVMVTELAEVDPTPYLHHFISDKEIPEALMNSQDFNCMAQAVYFEARGEPIEGQLAVAQVVLNRVNSKRYPNNVCKVVFQNEKWRHRCQFSFACDGKPDRPRHRGAWKQAQLISLVAVEGLWLDLTQKATHYHANYVSPDWSESIEPIAQYGAHYFYKGVY